MRLIPLDSIIVAPDRQRREFKLNELNELTDSIKTNGLFHPIVLRTEGDRHILVAGERRLRAIADLHALGTDFLYDSQIIPLNEVPYVSLSDLSPLAAEEAELDENIRRTNLTWQERATAHARLNSLRIAQAAERGAPAPSVADIAFEVRGSSEGVNQETTRRELIVARHLANPSVKAAKSVDEAFKILRKEEAAASHRALGAEVGRTFTADLHRAIHGDSLEWMRECPAGSFDIILTDPPYGMGADEFGDSGGLAAGAHGYVDSEENFRKLFEVFSAESFRVAKEQAHLYMFCDIDQLSYIKDELRTDGWWVFRTPLIWYKPGGMRAPWPEHGPQRKYETLVYAVKGKKPVLKMAPDVILCPPDSNLGHAAQKPVALFEDLLRRSVRPGDSVLDPFMGSGTIFPAAHRLKCKATGIEMDQASYGIAVKRIEVLRAQLELPL